MSSFSKHESSEVAGSVFFISSSGNVLKLPIPSNSDRDPLTWRWPVRAAAFATLQLYSIVASFEINLPGVLMMAIQHEFSREDMAPFSAKTLSSAMTLCTGFGYLISIPLSTAVGRRPVFLGASVVTALSTLWAGVVGDFYQLLVAISFQALAVGSAIGICLLIIMDATFIHERPNALSLFWCIGSVFIKGLLIVVPFTTDLSTDWRSVYKVWVGPCLFTVALCFLFVPETYFLRPPVAFDGRILVQSSSEKVEIYQNWEELQGTEVRPLPELPRTSEFFCRLKVSRAEGTETRAMVATYMQMMLCILNPLVFWVALLAGAILSGVVFLNLIQPVMLLQSPWNQASETSSIYLGVCGILGSLLALPATGPLIAWSTRYFTLRASGVRHAEVYLPGFAIPVVSGLISVGLNCLTLNKGWPPAFAYTASMLSVFSYLTGNVVFTLWITEAFPRWAAAALAIQLLTSNLFSFGIGSAIMPWIQNGRVLKPSLLIMALILTLGAIAVPVAFWGKGIRQYIHGRWSFSERGALRPQ